MHRRRPPRTRPYLWGALGLAGVAGVAALVILLMAGTTTAPLGPGPGRAAEPRPIEPSSGRIITVAQDGSGEYRSIQKAADVARPGDTVVISAGTYPEPLKVPRDGAAGAYITFHAKPGAAVIIDGQGERAADKGLVNLDDRSFIRLIGITVRGSSTHGIIAQRSSDIVLSDCEVSGSADGGAVFLSAARVLVERCEVYGNNARGTDASHEAVSFSDVDGFEIAHSVVRDNGEEGIDAKYEARNGRIHGNRVAGNRGPNIYIDSARNIEVYNNIVSGTTGESKAGISLAVEDFSETRRTSAVRIYNNVVFGNLGGGIGVWVESTGTFSDIQIVNNTVVGNRKGGLTVTSGRFTGENLLRNNVFVDNDRGVSGDASGFTADHNLFSSEPFGTDVVPGTAGFVDRDVNDLRPTEGSATIDTGAPQGAPAFDLTGAARPAGNRVDIGAYELTAP